MVMPRKPTTRGEQEFMTLAEKVMKIARVRAKERSCEAT